MTPGPDLVALVDQARNAGVELWAEGDRLRFRAPPGALDEDVKQALRERKADVVRLLQREAESAVTTGPIAANQQGLWLVHRLSPESAAYNLAFSARILGDFEVDPLREAFQILVDRHEALRTAYALGPNGDPERRVHGRASFALEVEDVPDDSAALRAAVEAAYRRPFDLQTPPLLRGHIFRSGDDTVLLIVGHHLAIDGQSLFLLLGDFFELHATLIRGAPLPARAEAAEFGEFVDWQQRMLEGATASADYWRSALTPPPPRLEIPADRPVSAATGIEGGTVTFEIEGDVAAAIREFGRSHGATDFTLLLAAWALWLGRLTGETDVTVGSPVQGRPSVRFEKTVGDFVNILPLRIRLDEGLGFESLLSRVRTTVLEGMAHQDFPLPLMAASDRGGAGPPFETMFVLQDFKRFGALEDWMLGTDGQATTFGALTLAPFPLDQQEGQFPLALDAWAKGDGWAFSCSYDSSVFDHSTAKRRMEEFSTLLRGIARNPEAPVGDLPIVPLSELSLLEAWNATEAPVSDETVVDMILARAKQAPEAVAVVAEDGSLTRAGLLDRARRIGAALGGLGVGPGDRVGVLLDRDHDLLPVLLGIMGTGAAYVPMDPRYPAPRLRHMAEDSSVAAVVTRGGSPASHGIDAPFLDLADGALPGPRPFPGVDADSIAYVIYTSGSTGRPKGIEVPHRTVANFLAAMARTPGLSRQDVLLAVTTISFDISVLELFGPLVVGARVVIASREVAADADRLADLIAAEEITVLQATPATWKLLVAAGWGGRTDLRALCGGEAMPPSLANDLLERTGEVWNLYGPTETTVWSTAQRIEAGEPIRIGRPIANTTVYVVDAGGRRLPIGAPGELWIGGAGVTRGYLGRPELTEERFISSPFRDGERVYRTGDLARFTPDGNLEYLGRLDHQVKVRGFRVEPGEIEARLLERGQVRQAVVVARGDRLVAYVVGSGESDALRRWVGDALPPYMVPSIVVPLDALPLTPNGKIDRNALPDPREGGGDSRADRVEPRNDQEAAILDIWLEILRVDDLGVHDDFFRAGGHSLAATRVVARIRDVFDADISLRDFFDHPTVAQTAARIRTEARPAPEAPPLVPSPAERPPLSFSQERIWFLQVTSPENVAYNISGAVLLEGPLDVERFRASTHEVARRQAGLRTRILTRGGRPWQRVDPDPTHTFHVEDLTHLPEDERLAAARERACDLLQEPYDVEAGPLFRPALFRLAPDRHLVAVGMHHVISDLWSMALFGQELAAIYENPASPPLAPIAVEYPDYAAWQREWLQGGPLTEQLEYWTRKLDGIRTLDLPTDFPRPQFFSFEGGLVRVELPEGIPERVQALTAEARSTPFMAYLAAFEVLLSTWARQDDLAVGVPIANRTRVESEALIGSFVNTLVHRADLSGDPTFREFLSRVRRTALGAYAHQDLPFEFLVKELNPARDTSRPPIFQVLFNVGNVDVSGGDFEGLRRSVVPLPRRGAQFELAMDIELNDLQSSVALSFNRALFTRETADRFVEHFLDILDRVSRKPDTRISELRDATEADREKLLGPWNSTDREHGEIRSVPSMLANTARRTPDRTAVVSASGEWSWAELHSAAGRVSAALVELGVRPGDRVGILVERSREMLAGLVGIMGAGAAYVPLDPAYPKDRIEYMLEHSEARAVVTHREIQARFDVDLPLVDLDSATLPAPVDFLPVDPEQAAYVIYTSGSTGRPKGVEVPHRAVANFLRSMAARPGLDEADRLLAVTTISFDISVLELYLPLLVGARVVIADEADTRDGRRLSERIAEEEITVMQATPATWKLMVSAGWEGGPDLRVLSGGEALPRELADALLARSGEVWNMYGPTETTVWSTVDRVAPDGPILVGTPIDNTRIYILDDDRQLLPIGVPGELWIAGDGVATGYVHAPTLTAERFADSPFRKGERMYRTGDLARWRRDGRLEHLGRLDHQVKVRGFRIELGEVEAALRAHLGVSDAVVTARDDRLLAYPILTLDAPSPGDLRRWVAERLPPYMVPGVFLPVESYPLTPNGKVDRKALPDPSERFTDREVHEPPAGPDEVAIAAVWQELLEVPKVGRGDNFFELGGHSLLAMEAVALVEERTGHSLDPRAFFFRSLAEIASSIPSSNDA